MTAPISTTPRNKREQDACDNIAEFWVRHFGGRAEWMAALPEIKALFDCEIDYRVGRIDLCGVVDTWTDDFSLGLADLERLGREIESWITVHRAAYGRF